MLPAPLTEAIASLLKLRQATLLDGIKALLNDPDFTGLAKSLYAHALVNPLSSGTGLTARPAYIQPMHFALALSDILRRTGGAGRPVGDMVAEIADPQLRDTLHLLWVDADGDVTRFTASVAAWFDAAMDRLAGWYKRQDPAYLLRCWPTPARPP